MKRETDISDFGIWMKARRKERGYKQYAFAKMVGIHENMVSRYETGDSVPRIDVVERIVNSLGAELVIREHDDNRELD